ncbi:MAG TPA: hypothetical protein VGP94_01940 [Tepidisphaeraceae bacterium]|jgi:hypothetical protein|nr:hypothetical protein [Tepidisphaeraceae bacterium]
MSTKLLDSVAARWSRLGAMLNVPAAARTPDIERLLLDTARVASANVRLFILAASWLAQYGDYVAKHRLARLIGEELEPQYRSTLGLMLEWAKHRGDSNRARFNLAIDACGSAIDHRPLLDVERRNPVLVSLAEKRASLISRKWGRWVADFEVKNDGLRPAAWIAEHNPALLERALTGGDLLASVLAECAADANAIDSEAELARRCGASRPAIRSAVRRLELAGRVHWLPKGRGHAIHLKQHAIAET